MATIAFNCPKCKYLCAFKDIYAGRRARCLNCNQIFIIPDKDGAKVQKVKQPREFDDPLPGFYKAILTNSYRAIFNFQSLPVLIFVMLTAVVKFYTFHMNYVIPLRGTVIFLPIGWLITFFIYGGLFWCYGEIVAATAFDVVTLPEITFGGVIGYVAAAFKSFYAFAIALIVVLLPAIIIRIILHSEGIEAQWAVYIFIAFGIFLFPMAILIVSITRDLVWLLRFDYYLMPIKNAFWHYFFLAVLFMIAWQLQYISPIYKEVSDKPDNIIYLNLLVAMALQIPSVIAMIATGVFYRHFACYFKF